MADEGAVWAGPDEAEMLLTRASFDQFVGAGGRPEDWPRLEPMTVSPDMDARFAIVRGHISVDVRKRDGEMVPCNICKCRKWSRSGFLLVDEQRRFFLIGPCCGAKYFGADTYRERISDYQFRERVRVAREALPRLARHAPELLRQAEELGQHAVLATAARKKLRNCGKLFAMLSRSFARDATLSVEVAVHAGQRGGLSHGTKVIARLRGKALCEKGFSICEDLRDARAVLEQYVGDGKILVERKDEDELPGLFDQLRAASQSVVDARSAIQSCQRFYDQDNLTGLRRYLTEEGRPERVVVYEGGSVYIAPHRDADEDFYSFRYADLLRPLPPDLSDAARDTLAAAQKSVRALTRG